MTTKLRTHCRDFFMFAILTALTSLIGGCRGTTAPEKTGSFAGRVILFDSTKTINGSYRLPLSDFSNVLVTIDNSSYSAETDSLGQWEIHDVPEGQYDLTASKQGFGAFHWYQQFLSDARHDLSTPGLSRMRAISPVISDVKFEGTYLGFNVPVQGQDTLWIEGYCDLDSTTQPSESHLACTITQTTEGCSDYFSISDLRAAGARSGQTLYVSASSAFSESNDSRAYVVSYYDPRYNETRWASTGPKSNVVKVIMP